MTFGSAASAVLPLRRIRHRLSPLAFMPSRSASRAPGSPPQARAISRNVSSNRAVRRERTSATSGNRSTKIRRLQAALSQKNLRLLQRIRTSNPCQGRSLRRRSYQLCTRWDDLPQQGHEPARRVLTTWIVAKPSAASTLSQRIASGLGSKQRRRTAAENQQRMPCLASWDQLPKNQYEIAFQSVHQERGRPVMDAR